MKKTSHVSELTLEKNLGWIDRFRALTLQNKLQVYLWVSIEFSKSFVALCGPPHHHRYINTTQTQKDLQSYPTSSTEAMRTQRHAWRLFKKTLCRATMLLNVLPERLHCFQPRRNERSSAQYYPILINLCMGIFTNNETWIYKHDLGIYVIWICLNNF